MPTISRFYGIIISMFYEDHNPPHFHAYYNEYKASFKNSVMLNEWIRWDIIYENARRFASNEPLLNELTPQQLGSA